MTGPAGDAEQEAGPRQGAGLRLFVAPLARAVVESSSTFAGSAGAHTMILHALATVLAPLAAVLVVASVSERALGLLRAYVGADRMLPPEGIAGHGTVLVTFVVAAASAGLMDGLHGVEALAGAAVGAGVGLSLHAVRLVFGGLHEARKQFRVAGGAARRRGVPLVVTGVESDYGYTGTGMGSGYVAYDIRLTLAGGEVLRNGYLDRATWERDLAGIELPASYRARFRHGAGYPHTSDVA